MARDQSWGTLNPILVRPPKLVRDEAGCKLTCEVSVTARQWLHHAMRAPSQSRLSNIVFCCAAMREGDSPLSCSVPTMPHLLQAKVQGGLIISSSIECRRTDDVRNIN